MRWRAYTYPRHGDTRTVRYFAFLPIEIDGELIWLEWYYAIEEYVVDSYEGVNYWQIIRIEKID